MSNKTVITAGRRFVTAFRTSFGHASGSPRVHIRYGKRLQSSVSSPVRSKASPNPWLIAAVGVVAGFAIGNIRGHPASEAKPIVYATRSQMLIAAEEISSLLGEDSVSYDEDVIEHHGHSDWSTANTPNRPAAVVWPRNTEEVSMIARVCSKHNVPMVAFGAGSSVEGNFSSPHSGITIDFTHMDKIVAFHPDDMDVVVQPGVNWVNLNNEIKDSGLFLPLDPSPTAMIGGMVSTNCSGTNAMRYGNMKDWVINLTVVLADGRVVKTRRRPRKTSAGYNLTGFFVGAEGTLGLVTEITLKLAPIPQDTSVAVVSFPSIRAATTAASRIIRSGIQLAALELMDDVQMQVVNRHGSAAVKKRKWEEEPTLFMKFSGTTDAIKSDIKRVQELIKNEKPGPFHFAKTKLEELDLWAARKEALFTMVSTRKEGTVLWSTDVAVPLSRLADIIDISKDECSKLGIYGTIIGHVGDANFHTAMFYDPHNAEQKAAVKRVVDDMMHRALEMDGTVSGEHAIGIGKKDCLVEELGQGTIDFMKTLKRAADPKWLLNPGKVFDLPDAA
ncbi:unnamed protein product [Zymoseptoria tritici ST99CH_1A5]|uniref:D-lactate dehydrogenase (cytochrome) n=1 Tax=Zymoseptoria tritici ST99CH_1A5 TaxID=1276529 RepID=A0A1Y6LK18_ZYMTR|nr:unnamed protein product [Zymoseptoria tritici ST99CH_1A5]